MAPPPAAIAHSPAAIVSLKPGRSEDLPDLLEQQRISDSIRRHFDASAPKRHRKPLRSDLEDEHPFPDQDECCDSIPPEYVKLQSLVHDSPQHLVGGFPSDVPEEFVETEYYKDLNAVDKSLHHTTGTGFIQVESKSPLELDIRETTTGLVRTKSRSNPAMNDWIPSSDVAFVPVSDKPHRSEP